MKKLTEYDMVERYEMFCQPRIDSHEICSTCPYWIEEVQTCGHLVLCTLEEREYTIDDEDIPF